MAAEGVDHADLSADLVDGILPAELLAGHELGLRRGLLGHIVGQKAQDNGWKKKS